jgi:hypothetical protein
MKDLDFYKAVINRKGLKVDKLLRKLAADKAEYAGFAIHVNYNALYEITEVYYVKFGDVRMSIDKQKAVLYDDWGKVKKLSINKKDFQYIDFYDPRPETIQRQVDSVEGADKMTEEERWGAYNGQILYWGELEGEYPLADYDAVLEDMETDASGKTFRKKSTRNNFLAAQVVVTNKAATEEQAQEFVDTFNSFTGPENAGNSLIVEKESEDDIFEIIPMELQKYDGMNEKTETTTKVNIIESFQIPKALYISATASIGDSTEIEQSTELYNGLTADDRLVFEEVFTDVFERFDELVNPSGDYSILPVPSAENKPLAEKLPSGGAEAVVSIIEGSLKYEQKLGTMKVLYGISEEDAIEMLGPKEVSPTPQPTTV